MRFCPYQTKEEYVMEYQGYEIGNKEIKKTVFIPCVGCDCAAYDSNKGECVKTGIICNRTHGSYLASGWTVEMIE
jgi:hypothetical protein